MPKKYIILIIATAALLALAAASAYLELKPKGAEQGMREESQGTLKNTQNPSFLGSSLQPRAGSQESIPRRRLNSWKTWFLVQDAVSEWPVFHYPKFMLELSYPSEYSYTVKGKPDEGEKFTGNPEIMVFFGPTGADYQDATFILGIFPLSPLYVADAYQDSLDKAENVLVAGKESYYIPANHAGAEVVYIQMNENTTLLFICPSWCRESDRQTFRSMVGSLQLR